MSDITLVNGDSWILRVDSGQSTGLEAALSRAVYADHPCEDYEGCDIARARAEGYTYVAAHLLRGATETPTMDTLTDTLVPRAYDGVMRREDGWPAGWAEWTEFHRTYGVQCEACNGYTYGDDSYTPDVCSDCRAPLTAPTPAVVD